MTTCNTIEKRIELFREKFTLDPSRVFFGDPEELKKQGWEVGESKLIIKQDSTPEELEQFLIESMEQVRKETLEKCIREVKYLEIRTDSGGEIYNEYTELMRDEVISTLKELKPNE